MVNSTAGRLRPPYHLPIFLLNRLFHLFRILAVLTSNSAFIFSVSRVSVDKAGLAVYAAGTSSFSSRRIRLI